MLTTLPQTMPAIRKLNDAPGLNYCHDIALPEMGPRDVLVAVTHAGICGTDRHIYEWDAWSRNRVKMGITTGHEFVGRVVAVGEATQRTKVGQRVSAEGHIGCGFCEQCRTGNGHICNTVDILGIDCNGCFAPFIAVPETNIWPVHADIPDKVAAVFDPLGNAVHTVMAAGVSGKTVLITGVGIIGLMAVTVAKAAGATRIFVTDLDQRRMELAMKLGAEQSFDAQQPWVEKLRQATSGGPQVLLEMSGNATAIRNGMDVIRKTEEQFVFRDDDNCKIRTLSPLNLEKDVEFYEVTLHPQGRLESAAHFQGTREFLTVQSGSIEVQSGEVSVVLKKGDSVQYAADVDHSINNIGKRDAVIFLVDIYSSSH